MPSLADAHRSASAVSGWRSLRRLLRSSLACLLVLWLMDFAVVVVDSRPVRYHQQRNFSGAAARWINPCDLPGHLFDPALDMIGAPNVDEGEVAQSVVVRGKIALNQAKKLRDTFIARAFADPSLVEGTASHRLSWLPKVTRKELEGKSIQALCRYWYRVLQFYGVALEQVILDLTFYDDGTLLPMCQEAENFLTQTLCQVHLATFMLRIRLNPDVTRDVMKQEYRSGTHSERTLRNYIIFRDYAAALEVMVESFEAAAASPPQRTFTPPFYNTPPLYNKN